MHFKTIAPLSRFLLPVDGSETSKRAVSFAGCLATGLGKQVSGITLLHVLAGTYLGSHMANVDFRVNHILKSDQFQQFKNRHIADSVEPLMAEAEEKLRLTGVETPIERRVVDGDPAEQITKIGAEKNCSTVIMGRTGRSEIQEILLGSVTSSTLHRPHNMSVYVVGSRMPTADACLLPRILIPVDGSIHSLAAVREAAVLGKCYGATLEKIILLHVVDLARYSELLNKGLQPEEECDEILNEARSILFEAGIAKEKVETVAEYGKPAQIIVRVAEEREITLLMLSRRGRSTLKAFFLGSVSNEIIYRCTGPTVAVVCGGTQARKKS